MSEHLTMRRCGWWESLSGSEPTDGGSRTIVIPTARRLGPCGIAPLIPVAEGGQAMNTEGTNIALAESVTPRAVHAYLAANGWIKLGPYHGDTGDVYCLREDEREAVLVPASSKFADYVTRLIQLAETLERVENRRQSTILTDLSLAEVDLIRVRLPKTYEDSSIPLSAGVGLLDESRKLLLAAACSASRPQRLFRAGRNQKAAAYIDHVRLGQTEPGSFVVNLLAPVTPSLTRAESAQMPLLDPFERRVAHMLVSGLRTAREATELVNRGGRHWRIRGTGLQGCQCEPVPSDRKSDQHRQRTGCVRELGAHKTAHTRARRMKERRVAFTPSDAPVLEEAARILSDRQERCDERIEGYVSALARDQSDPEGRATIRTVDRRSAGIGQGRLQPVRVHQDYRCPRQTVECVARRRPAAGRSTLAPHESPRSDGDRRRRLMATSM